VIDQKVTNQRDEIGMLCFDYFFSHVQAKPLALDLTGASPIFGASSGRGDLHQAPE
jgi:hypothetical protein